MGGNRVSASYQHGVLGVFEREEMFGMSLAKLNVALLVFVWDLVSLVCFGLVAKS